MIPAATTTTTPPPNEEPDEIMKFYEKLGMTYTLCILAGLVVLCFLFGMLSFYTCCTSSRRRDYEYRSRGGGRGNNDEGSDSERGDSKRQRPDRGKNVSGNEEFGLPEMSERTRTFVLSSV
jgi:hypothetical protein